MSSTPHNIFEPRCALKRMSDETKYIQPDAANFNSWRRHIRQMIGNSQTLKDKLKWSPS